MNYVCSTELSGSILKLLLVAIVTKMVDLLRTCRTCMKSGEALRDLFSVFQVVDNTSLTLADIIVQATSLQIKEKDDLPQKLCNECEEKIRIMYTFRKQALESDYELKKIILSCTPIKDEDSDNDFKNENYNEFVNYYDEVLLLNTDLSHENNGGRHQTQLNNECERYSNKNISDEAEITCLRRINHKLYLDKHNDSNILANKNALSSKLEVLDSTVKAESNTYDCIFCKMKFESHEHLLVHLMEHNKNKPFKCGQCDEEYLVEMSLLAHKKKYHPSVEYSKGQYKCVSCVLSFFSEDELLSHICKSKTDMTHNIKEEPSKRFKCKLCNQQYEKKRSLLSHFKVHTREIKTKIFICDFCQKEFTQKGALKRHIELHTKDKRYKCTECPKTYSRYDQYTSHLRKHSGIKPYVCEHCDKGFTQLCSLKDHVRTHTGEAPYLCAECGKKFKNNSNLRQHLKRHSGVKPFACALCPQTFCAKGQMKAHMDTHSGAHPFACAQCGAAFTKANSLKKHSLLHLGLKPFACDSCDMSFTCKDHLKRHQRKHTGEKPYRCTRCPRAFTQSNDLRKHMRVHDGQNIYPCSVCGVKFRLMRELRRHYPSHYAAEAPAGGPGDGGAGAPVGGAGAPAGGHITITFSGGPAGGDARDFTINIDAEKIN